MSSFLRCRATSLCGRRASAPLSQLRRLSNTPTVIKPSETETASGLLEARNLEKAVGAVHRDGLVVVEDVVPHDILDHLNEKMVEDARVLQARGKDGPYNYNLGNLQLDAPPVAEYFNPKIFTNTIATQITSTVLGPRPKWTFCSANAAMPPPPSPPPLPGAPPAARQPVHSDADFRHPDHPFALVVNVPLVAMTPANGATELWLGTHHGSRSSHHHEDGDCRRASGRVREADLAARRAVRPPCQPAVARGSVVVRDLRLWHAGMPNASGGVRVMLALIHFAPWYRSAMRLRLAADIEPVLGRLEREGRLGLEVPVDWVSREEALGTYLDRGFGNSYDFDQTP